jgi:P27 family predicted phage terminase small subunit
MQRGPKPKPTNLRLLQGAPPRRGEGAEPIPPPSDQPKAPPWLNSYALEEWERLADDLYGMGILTGVDQTMLAAYCMAYARWRQAEEDLQVMADADPLTHGALLKTKEGNAIQNPLVGVANVARRDMARLAAEFGLSPSSRTLIDAGKRGEHDPVASRYFGRS